MNTSSGILRSLAQIPRGQGRLEPPGGLASRARNCYLTGALVEKVDLAKHFDTQRLAGNSPGTAVKALPSGNCLRQNDLVNFRNKIVSWDNLTQWREALRKNGQKLVVTNGCFDLLHLGHVTYLEVARNLGDALLIGVNSDEAVRQLKGPTRPVNTESDRVAILAALESVNGVCIFQDKRATHFLAQAQPDIYVKGGDYTLETLDKDERQAVEAKGGKIIIIPFVPGVSTTAILQRITAT